MVGFDSEHKKRKKKKESYMLVKLQILFSTKKKEITNFIILILQNHV